MEHNLQIFFDLGADHVQVAEFCSLEQNPPAIMHVAFLDYGKHSFLQRKVPSLGQFSRLPTVRRQICLDEWASHPHHRGWGQQSHVYSLYQKKTRFICRIKLNLEQQHSAWNCSPFLVQENYR
jgi:hypothetical protein